MTLDVNNLPANVGDSGDAGMIPVSGRSPGGGPSNPLWYSCLENLSDRGTWQATGHGIAKSDITEQLGIYTCVFFGTDTGTDTPESWPLILLYHPNHETRLPLGLPL